MDSSRSRLPFEKPLPPNMNSSSEAILPVLQVADPTLRDQLLRAMMKNLRLEAEEARAAISAAPLSAEQKITCSRLWRRWNPRRNRMRPAKVIADSFSLSLWLMVLLVVPHRGPASVHHDPPCRCQDARPSPGHDGSLAPGASARVVLMVGRVSDQRESPRFRP